jgi:adenine/guanine phosphoribosyltransferase-like PRPP-binding protein
VPFFSEHRGVTQPVGTYPTKVGSQSIDLPIVAIADDVAIALFITVDQGVAFSATAGVEIAEAIRGFDVDVVASVATMGIPVAIEITRALDLDDYLIFQKTPKIHLADAIVEPVRSITTDVPQRLLFDRARIEAVAGKRVALVDDVISTGASIRAALALLRRVGAIPVAIGAVLSETNVWRASLGEDQHLVHALGAIPLFRRGLDGTWMEDWDGDGSSLPKSE